MMRVLLALLATLVVLGSAPLALAQKPSAERPTYQVGETWVVNDIIYTLARVDGETYVFTAGGDREMHLTRHLVVTKLVFRGKATFEVWNAHQLPWPLEVGKSRHDRVTSARGIADVTTTVDAYEEVTVRAGRFKAFKVTALFTNPQARPLGTLTVWYAPEVRRWR